MAVPKGDPAPSNGSKPKAVADLSRELEGLLLESQLARKVPKGKAKCPKCGALLEPTRTKKVRTHFDPLKTTRCEASGKAWKEFGLEPPKPAAAEKAKPKKRRKR